MKGATRRPPKHSIPHPLERKERLAYVTWLSSTVSGPDKDNFNDGYIVATRILVYQLFHTPKTRTNKSIDVVVVVVVVVVTPDVSESRRKRLRKTGHCPTHRIPVRRQRLTAFHERALARHYV